MPTKPSLPKCNSAEMVNRPPIPEEWKDRLVEGETRIAESIARLASESVSSRRSGNCRIAIDGHLGVPSDGFLRELTRQMRDRGLCPEAVSVADALRSPSSLERMLKPYLPADPTFGRVYGGTLWDFFDKRKLATLRNTLKSFCTGQSDATKPNVLIYYGSGASGVAPRSCFEHTIYVDLCREEILKRLKMGLATPIGTKPAKTPKRAEPQKSDALPAYFSTRRLYYVDYAVLDKHRHAALKNIDCYIDGNCIDLPKMLPAGALEKLFGRLVQGPVKPKPYYDPGPWGGQWLKEIRGLPKDMVNCAWSYDLIEPETSFLVAWNETSILEFPFPVLTSRKPQDVLGARGRRRRFQGQFPIRINYDDSYEGGDMALQCHPGDRYIKEQFNEPYRQDESYYIVDTGPGSKVHLGLKEEADLDEFRNAVVRAEKEGIPFDHNEYVNSVASEPGDLFLIPAGTLHGSGKNETVLEISATTYRYTFHFYDFLRPGLDGKIRPIHSDHAFAALKPRRRTRWVQENLKQEPRLIRKGKGWKEFLLGSRRDMFFKVHRLEFTNRIVDDTQGKFHLIVPVVGTGVQIIPYAHPESVTELRFSYLALLPATMGQYRLQSVDDDPCQVVKVLLA